MIEKYHKLFLPAALVLAITLTFSCSSGGGSSGGGGGGDDDHSSSSGVSSSSSGGGSSSSGDATASSSSSSDIAVSSSSVDSGASSSSVGGSGSSSSVGGGVETSSSSAAVPVAISSSSSACVASWSVTTPATCYAAGEKTESCTGNKQAIDKLAWTWKITTHASQDAHGIETGTCTDTALHTETRELYMCGTVEYDPIDEFCQSSGVKKTKCGGSTYSATQECCGNLTVGTLYNPATDFCTRSTTNPPRVVSLCGGKGYDTRTKFCYNNAVTDKCGGTLEYNPATQFCQNVTNEVKDLCGTATYTKDEFCDFRDNKLYKLVTIGTQTWMAENLNYETTDGNSKCYSNNTANCTTYGRLYNWATAMGVCPTDWHLPSRAEWDALNTFISADQNCTNCDAKHLRSPTLWSGGTGLDTYGFSALPGGYGLSGGDFYNVGDSGLWWSASENGSDLAYLRKMSYNYESANYDISLKYHLFSVRCLQD